MRNFFRTTKFRICLAVLFSLFLGFFVAAVSNSGSSPISSALSTVLTPLENAAAALADTIDDFNGWFVSSKNYADKIEELKLENAELRSQLVDYEKTLHKLRAYEEFLDVKDRNPDYSFTPATVILKDSSDIYGSFTLNKGSDDGVSVNDPVIYGEQLVGTVKSVNKNNCTVYTLFNPDVSVSAYEIRTREDCYTETEFSVSKDGLIVLSGLAKNTSVVSGGIVCTSGIGGLYPKDLIIGTVKSVQTDVSGLGITAFVEPDADYSQLNDVFIITDFEGKNS